MGKHSRAPRRPLVITADEGFLDQVLTLAAASKTEIHVAHDVASARRHWLHASVVVVDEQIVEQGAKWSLDRRPDVVLVGRDLDDANVWQRALNVGAEHVVFTPDATDWLTEKIATTVRANTAEIFGVIGGCGGAGASTFSVALALQAVADKRDVVLVDADPYGGGIDMLMGAENQSGMRWDGLLEVTGNIDRAMLVDALPKDQGLAFLSFSSSWTSPPSQQTAGSVMAALADGGDVVVVDLGDVRDQAVAAPMMATATSLVMVVPARVRAVAAAQARLGELDYLRERLHVVVRKPAPGGLDAEEIAQALDLPLLGTIGNDGRRAEWEEHGIAPDSRSAWSCASAVLHSGRDVTRPAA